MDYRYGSRTVFQGRTGRRRRHRARMADHELAIPRGLDPARQTLEQTLAGHQVACLREDPALWGEGIRNAQNEAGVPGRCFAGESSRWRVPVERGQSWQVSSTAGTRRLRSE